MLTVLHPSVPRVPRGVAPCSESVRERALAVLVGAAVAAALHAPVEAQAPDRTAEPWMEDIAIGAVNAVVGGITGAVTAWLRDEDVEHAFVRGSVGGGVVFVGKRIAVEEFDGAGLLGRQVGAVGSSVVRNASVGDGWLDEVWLPLGPLWIQASPRAPHRLRVNVWDLAVVGWAATRSELELDWGASASSGAAVFRAPNHRLRDDDEAIGGLTTGSVVLIGPASGEERRELVRGHELVHVLQHDFFRQAWERPLEAWGWSRLLGLDPPLDLSLMELLLLPAFSGSAIGEAEAGVLEVR